MKWIDEAEARDLLKSDMPNFLYAMQTADEDWKKVAAQYPDVLPRTRANFKNDQIRKYIRERYEEKRIKEPGQAFFLLIHGLAARFRRLYGSRPSNIPTNQALLFEKGQLLLGDSLDAPIIVNVGYVPVDKSHTKFRYKVTMTRKKVTIWEIDLTDQVEITKAVEISDEDTQQTGQTKRVRKKKAQ